MKLHPNQKIALDKLFDFTKSDQQLIALTGAAGTGKSEILSRLIEMNESDESTDRSRYILDICATTNKAAARLAKDIPSATTVHGEVAKPMFKPLYTNLESFIKGHNKIKKIGSDKDIEEYVEQFNFITEASIFLSKYNLNVEEYTSIQDLIHNAGVGAFDPEIFDSYALNDPKKNKICVIDECSMLSTKSQYVKRDDENGKSKLSLITIGLDNILKVFNKAILVGDDAQLPPIEGNSGFDGVECVELTENFRSEKDLLRAIQWARDGNSFYNWENDKLGKENVKVVNGLSDNWYKNTFGLDNVVHIVYRNNTRHEIVKKVREINGHKKAFPKDREPFIWRGKSDENVVKGELGIFNESKHYVEFENYNYYMYDYTTVDGYENKMSKQFARVQYHYALTCHSAQGSSIDHVIVHVGDIPYFIDDDTKKRWIYTAVSRAAKSLTIVL